MKKLLFLLIMVSAPVAAKADFVGPTNQAALGGFDGPSEQAVMTVAEVTKLGDDKAVVMKGSIEKHLTKDKYQFVDPTGRVVVEIDGEEWRGQRVKPEDTVLIIGETDKEIFRDMVIDVKSIEVIQNQ